MRHLHLRHTVVHGTRPPIAAAIGLIIGRLATLAIDDPDAIRNIADLLVIRSGVEFWPGVLAAMRAAGWTAHRDDAAAVRRIADLAPLAMIGYGVYEVACFVRGGCYGPYNTIGLRPDGLTTPMIPVGAILGLVVAGGSVLVRGISQRRTHPLLPILAALWIVATSRSVASFWLPKLGTRLTRQHLSSFVVSGMTAAALVVFGVVHARRTRGAT